MPKFQERIINIRGPVAAKDRTIALRVGDFLTLRKAATGLTEIKHIQKDFDRLQKMGLVKHRFDQSGDWPKAIAVLTQEGEQALAQEVPT